MWFSEEQIVDWRPKLAALVVEDEDDEEECKLYVSQAHSRYPDASYLLTQLTHATRTRQNPEDGGCLVEDTGDPQADRASVVEALQAMLEKEGATANDGAYSKAR